MLKMMYATKFNNETMARAQGIALPVSFKQSVEVCRFIKNRRYKDALRLLEGVKEMKTPVPYKTFNRGGTGHRKGIGPGRYPQKASTYVITILRSAYANASQKGLDTENLVVKAAVAKQGPKTFHYGRKRGTKAKRTHIEIVVESVKKKAGEPKAEAKKAAAEKKPSKNESTENTGANKK